MSGPDKGLRGTVLGGEQLTTLINWLNKINYQNFNKLNEINELNIFFIVWSITAYRPIQGKMKKKMRKDKLGFPTIIIKERMKKIEI